MLNEQRKPKNITKVTPLTTCPDDFSGQSAW